MAVPAREGHGPLLLDRRLVLVQQAALTVHVEIPHRYFSIKRLTRSIYEMAGPIKSGVISYSANLGATCSEPFHSV